ncbi:hypothetical protein HZA26_02930 [Candidatus Nomurabacteria bacterium]|nr:hypothetical protein [Candidatus Nomurabacteria bacterium]
MQNYKLKLFFLILFFVFGFFNIVLANSINCDGGQYCDFTYDGQPIQCISGGIVPCDCGASDATCQDVGSFSCGGTTCTAPQTCNCSYPTPYPTPPIYPYPYPYPYPTPPVNCGNGVVDSGEQCDSGANNGACPRACSNSCTVNDCSPPPVYPTPPVGTTTITFNIFGPGKVRFKTVATAPEVYTSSTSNYLYDLVGPGSVSTGVPNGTIIIGDAYPETGAVFTNWITACDFAAYGNTTVVNGINRCFGQANGGTISSGVVFTAIPVTGTLLPANSSCTIQAGQNNCASPTLTWTTSGFTNGHISAVTSPTGTPSPVNGNSGSGSFTVPYNPAGVNFFLHNNSVQLAQANVQTLCAAGTAWSGTACQSYIVYGSAGPNGSISPATRTVAHGANTTFTVTPNSGYVASASGCGGSLSGTTYTTGAITAGCTVTATFTANPVMSGTLTPAQSSCQIVANANTCNINFSWNTINPVATSAITRPVNITVASGNSGANVPFGVKYNSETFYLYNNNVLLDQETVTSSCVAGTGWNGLPMTSGGACKSYIVTGTAGANGSISPGTQGVAHGATTTLTVTPNPGYIASASGCGGSLSGNTYTTGVITANCTVTASFTPGGGVGVCATPPNGGTYSSAPGGPLCSQGTASPSSLSGSGPWFWQCLGTNGGSSSDDVNCSASYNPGGGSPTVDLKASQTQINVGGSLKLTWTSANVSSCTGTGFNTSGAVSNSAGVSVSPTTSTTYYIDCDNGAAKDNVYVEVNPAVNPLWNWWREF